MIAIVEEMGVSLFLECVLVFIRYIKIRYIIITRNICIDPHAYTIHVVDTHHFIFEIPKKILSRTHQPVSVGKFALLLMDLLLKHISPL